MERRLEAEHGRFVTVALAVDARNDCAGADHALQLADLLDLHVVTAAEEVRRQNGMRLALVVSAPEQQNPCFGRVVMERFDHEPLVRDQRLHRGSNGN